MCELLCVGELDLYFIAMNVEVPSIHWRKCHSEVIIQNDRGDLIDHLLSAFKS